MGNISQKNYQFSFRSYINSSPFLIYSHSVIYNSILRVIDVNKSRTLGSLLIIRTLKWDTFWISRGLPFVVDRRKGRGQILTYVGSVELRGNL